MGVTNALCEETPHASRRKYPWFSRYTTPVPSGITHVHFLTRLSRVALFDLDDTLIPTEWVRRAFLTLRPSDAEAQKFHEACVKSQQKVFDSWDGCRISPKSFKEDLNLNFIEKSIRTRLRNLAKVDFDQQAASLIEKSCKAFGVVVVVTNARSSVWLHVVSTLFPKLKAQLRRFSIPVIQAAAVANRVTFVNNNDYFQYWANLKRVQFQRVVSATASHLEKIRASLLKNTLSASRSAGLQNCYGPLASVAAATLGSPRTHRRESQELESLLLEWDINPSPVANEHLGRLLRHQLGRSMLYHFAQDHAEIARLPYDLHAVFSNDPFPPTARNTAASVKYEPILGGALAPQRLDIVCVGDSDFELFAARDLAVNVLPNRTIASLGLIKCRTGLGPNAFCSQLFDIEQAIQYMIKCIQQRRNSASGLRVFGPSVVAEYTTSNDKFHTDLLGHRSTAGTVLGSAAAYCWPKSMRCTTAVGRGSWAPAGPWFSEPRTGIKPFQVPPVDTISSCFKSSMKNRLFFEMCLVEG